jgi:cystathionine beta-lyase/cystathionine gamma-synthase
MSSGDRGGAGRLEAAATLLAHDDDLVGGAVIPPIFQTSLFTFESYAELAACFAGRDRRPLYSRGDNPTVMEFERKVAALEGAEAARACSSGMAAISATVLAFVRAGERVVAVRNAYGDAYRLFARLLPRLGISVEYVDGSDPAAVEAALPGAGLLYLESPTSMAFELQDVPALARLARAQGVLSVIDNSWATPLFQRPLAHGVDLVLHSASKYLGGHSDTVAGVVAGSATHIDHINRTTQPYLGAKLSPLEAWLLLRGLRTLALRLPRHQASGLLIAGRLREHPAVTRVLHPAWSDHPGRRTLEGFSGLFSFEVADGVDVPALVDGLRLFRIGVSWGGHESLVMPAMASLEQSPDANSLRRFGIGPRLVRLHVGLEDPEALWADLAEALSRARRPLDQRQEERR